MEKSVEIKKLTCILAERDKEIEELQKELEKLKESLRKYGTHKQDCYLNLDDIPVSQKHCSCGFFEVKSLLNKLEGGKHGV